jgi:beta-glucosidase
MEKRMSYSTTRRRGPAPTSRRGRTLRHLAILATAFVVAACGSSSPSATEPGTAQPSATGAASLAAEAWLDTSLPIKDRVAALLAEMTLDEKIGQMSAVINQDPSSGWQLRDAGDATTGWFGAMLSGGDGNPSGANTAQNWYAMIQAYQQAALKTRLAIPMLYGVDAVHGDAHVGGTTVFPHNIGMGATRDPALVEKACQVTAAETAATGARWDFGPVVAVVLDVRWGRTYESYGENTDLVSQLGTACLQGLQGDSLTDQQTVVADPKHYLGDGGTAWGSSTASAGSSQYMLDQGVTQFDNDTIADLFLPPYRQAVDGGARVIMASYTSTQSGGKVHGDSYWLTDKLKGELGFTGFVVSDWGGIGQLNADYREAVKQGINAGIDMAMLPGNWREFANAMKSLVASGEISQARVDDAVSRILTVKFEMGLFENPLPPSGEWANVGSAANRAVARQAVAESAVLLKTGSGVLPVAKSGKTVLLAGPAADDIGLASGGWTLTWQGQAGNLTEGTTLKEALEAQLGSSLTYSADAMFSGSGKADVGIVVVSERPYAEGVGDSATLALPAEDVALIARMRPLVDKLIVIVYSGRPVVLDGIAGQADALIAAWLPGTEAGSGLADVLFGDVPFTGQTPFTWPKTADDSPRYGKSACEGAVYPYDYGLDATGKLLGPAAC